MVSSIPAQLRGNMFRLRAQSMCFLMGRTARHAVHMWFVPFRLAIIFLDEEGHVVDYVHLSPFEWYRSRRPARSIIELPSRAVQPDDVRIGDRLRFEEPRRKVYKRRGPA